MVWRQWICSWTLEFVDFQLLLGNITKVNKYFVGILNLSIALPTKNTKLNVQQIKRISQYIHVNIMLILKGITLNIRCVRDQHDFTLESENKWLTTYSLGITSLQKTHKYCEIILVRGQEISWSDDNGQTASIKPRLLFSRAGYASWGLPEGFPFHQFNITYYSCCLVPVWRL